MSPETAKDFGLIDEVVAKRSWYTISRLINNPDLININFL
jgi:hypothetical protein